MQCMISDHQMRITIGTQISSANMHPDACESIFKMMDLCLLHLKKYIEHCHYVLLLMELHPLIIDVMHILQTA